MMLKYVAGYIAKAIGTARGYPSVEPAGPTHMQCDPTRAMKTLGWKAKTPIEEGLNRAITVSR